ncbi:DUF2520 domain-containing protein [Agriterribacter sp.]|uniref:Rossmann-like and DUF2520 domain-containing protein n=1 Tax=Agriterribacter sp. TaxID=2821509 RepID=UPI002BFFA2CE|nr:DUF2520 domain-containing protein [Agriterribacter sp.]HRP57686.1 DUF2520 domain-containing protein [Agriterribacter sp.]
MRIVIIGTGNTATVLGRKALQCGHQVVQVVGRNAAHAQTLGLLLQAPYSDSFYEITDDADIYIIAVSDAAVSDIENWLPIQIKGIAVHTAGAVSKSVLKNAAGSYGVLYPLQSLRSDRHAIPEIPLLIDANSPGALQSIQTFAASLSGKVYCADDDERMKLHLGAVIANNFTNYLYTLTQDFCAGESLDFSLLLPLLHETVQRLEQYPARLMQTGPAIRNDRDTIAKHLSLLKDFPVLSGLYAQLSGSISAYYNELQAG